MDKHLIKLQLFNVNYITDYIEQLKRQRTRMSELIEELPNNTRTRIIQELDELINDANKQRDDYIAKNKLLDRVINLL